MVTDLRNDADVAAHCLQISGSTTPVPGAGVYAVSFSPDGRRLRARSVVIASGASYRRPGVPRLAEFEGRGVWYWASPVEAKLCAGEEVALVCAGVKGAFALDDATLLAAAASADALKPRGVDLSQGPLADDARFWLEIDGAGRGSVALHR